MSVPDLTLREDKGLPLTAKEMDTNLKLLRDYANAQDAIIGVSLNADGTIKNPGVLYGASVVGTDAYAFNPSPAIAAYSDLIGRLIVLKADVISTGAATLEISGLTAKAIKKFSNQDIDTNDIKVSQFVLLSWDGTYFQMQSWPGVVQPINYGADSGIADAYVVEQSGWIYIPATLASGYEITFKATYTNTTTSTLRVGSQSAKTIKSSTGDVLVAGNIVAGRIYTAIYNGTDFQLTTPVSAPTAWTALSAQAMSAAHGTLSFTHTIGAVPSGVRVVGLLQSSQSDLNYTNALGHEVDMSTFYSGNAGVTYPVGVSATSAAIDVHFSGWTLFAPNRTVDDVTAVTRSKWNVKVYVAR